VTRWTTPLAYTFRFPTDSAAMPYLLVFRVDAGEALGMASDTPPARSSPSW